MKTGSRIIVSLYIGYAVYSLLTLVYGQSGLVALDELKAYREKLVRNLEEIQETNRRLHTEIDLLRSETDHIRRESRRIGYFEHDEGIIHIEGYENRKNHYAVGKIIRWEISQDGRKKLFRSLGLASSLLMFLVMTLSKRKGVYPRS
ncbi:MAG: FtsB family cell division protein [Spirochaetia bacterium]